MGVHYTDVSLETFEAHQRVRAFDAAETFTQEDRNLIGPRQTDGSYRYRGDRLFSNHVDGTLGQPRFRAILLSFSL